MNYAAYVRTQPPALGELSEWSVMSGHTLDNDEVYVLRLTCEGLPLREGSDLLLFARAAGQGQNLELGVRAVGAWKAPGMGENAWMIDVVMASVDPNKRLPTPLVSDDAAAMAKQVAADSEVKQNFPSLVIKNAVFGELVAPSDAVDAWRSQALLWDPGISGPKSRGGPTATFEQPVERSLFKGKADDGRNATSWGVTDGKKKPQDRPGIGAGWYALGGLVLVAGAGMVLWSRRKR